MIAKRVGAAALAVLLILGAWVVRDRVIEGDDDAEAGGEDDDRPIAGDVLYCITELSDVCRAVRGRYHDLDVRIEAAATTLDTLAASDASDAMWLTLEPLPAIAGLLRSRHADLRSLDVTNTAIGSSPLTVVVVPESSDALVAACGNPVDLACLADQTSLSPTFAPIDTATGLLGVAAAAASFGGEALDVNGIDFTVWARRLAHAGATQLSGGTAVQTIQTRPSFDVAIGAAAEIAPAQRERFEALAPDQPIWLDATLMIPRGVAAPDGLVDQLTDRITASGWAGARSANEPTGLPPEGVIVAVGDIWEDLT